MTDKPIIVVLEDMDVRVNWLKRNFGDTCEILWCESVESFFHELRTIDRERIKLIILDHDLGTGSMISEVEDRKLVIPDPSKETFPYDTNGENGMHAAQGLGPWREIPTVVWSINSARAPSMKKELEDRGTPCAWIPFCMSNFRTLQEVISQLV